jgi:type II secretory pathway pseudopilin PulG
MQHPGQFVPTQARRAQRGYALLSIIVLGAILIVTAAAALPNIFTQGTREQEAEMIWRGKQYARAVKLFYRKNGRFPASLDELIKKQGNLRYLRKEYKDPFNREDGKWRLIYVLPNGQLVGSLTRVNILLQVPGQPQRPGAQGPPPAGVAPQAGTATGQPAGGSERPPTQSTGTTFGGSTGQLVGGSIIGVGGKVPQQSIRIYNGAQTYREWEFIWDPSRDAPMGVPGGVPGATPGTQPGTGQPPGGRPLGGPPRRP